MEALSVSRILITQQGGLVAIFSDSKGSIKASFWQIPSKTSAQVQKPDPDLPVRPKRNNVETCRQMQKKHCGDVMKYSPLAHRYVTVIKDNKDTILHILNAIPSMITVYPWSYLALRELRKVDLLKRRFTIKTTYALVENSGHGEASSLDCYQSEEIFTLNKNNNGNAYEDNDAQAATSRRGDSKSDQTIGTKSRHSYQNKRRATNKQPRCHRQISAQHKIEINATIHCDNHSDSPRHQPRNSDDPTQEVPMEGTQLRLNQDQAVVPAPLMPFAPDSRTIYPPFLNDMLNNLAKYKTASDIPPMMKERLFQFVFQFYKNGGCKPDASISSHPHHDAKNQPPTSPQVGPEYQHVEARERLQLPEQKNKQQELEEYETKLGEKMGTGNNRQFHVREKNPSDKTENPLVFLDEFNHGDQDIRSPSFVSPGQLGHSDSFFDVNFLGQQDDNAMDVCYNYDPDNIPRGVTNHMEDIAEVDKHVDGEKSAPSKEPFTSDYVFRMVFGSSFTIPSHYWYIHPPVLPSRVVQIKVHEDGISDKVIGKGCFGQVIAATLRVYPGQSRDVVVKEHFMNKSTEGDIINEVRIAMYLESTGCVPICYGVLRDMVGNLSIVLELFGSGKTLHDLLAERTLSREDWLDIACQLAIGLCKIHDKGILINDLKADNILVNLADSVPHVKFCDMGSASYKSGVIYEDGNMERFVHLAPEVRAHTETTEANDVYGLGRVIKKIHYASRISALLPLSAECLAKNPTDRLPLHLLSQHLTNMYRNELMFPSITVPCCGQLPSSDDESEADSDVELKSVSQEDEVIHAPNQQIPFPLTLAEHTKISTKLTDERANVCETQNNVLESTESDYAPKINNKEYEHKVDCDCSIDFSPKLSPRTSSTYRRDTETSCVESVQQLATLPESAASVQVKPTVSTPSESILRHQFSSVHSNKYRPHFSFRTRAEGNHSPLRNQFAAAVIASVAASTIYHEGIYLYSAVGQDRCVSAECIVRDQTKLGMLPVSTGSASISSATVHELPTNAHHSSNRKSVICPGQSVSAITPISACELFNTLTNTGTAVTPVVCCTIPNRIVPQSVSAETVINEVQMSSTEFHTPYASPILNVTANITSAFESSAKYRTHFGSASPSSAFPVSPTEFLSAAPSRSGTHVSYADFGTILGTVATSDILEEPNVPYVPDDQDNSENEAEVYGTVVESAPELCLYLFIALVLPVLLFCGIFGFV